MKNILLALVLSLCLASTTFADALHNKIAAGSNNATVVKTTSGRIKTISPCNSSAAVKYVKFYNLAVAPTCGTSTPMLRFVLPAGLCMPPLVSDNGIPFNTGVGYCMLGGAADSDNTAVTANDVFLQFTYQ